MTPKDKAKELVDKYKYYLDIEINNTGNKEQAKLYALIAVDEIIHYLEIVLGVDKEDFEYWQEVKEEINNL